MDIKITHSLLTQYLKTEAKPQKIAELLSLCGPTVDRLEKTDHDWVYHIEIITNRVDSAGAFGVAREAYAILNQHGISAELINNPYKKTVKDLGKLPTNKPVTVSFSKQELVPHFACIALKNITIKPSPKSLVDTLELCGERGLNNIIDISNELTLKYGQPVHIFDLDRIKKQTLRFRESKPKESIITLDKKTHQLPGGDIVIEDGEGRLIDLCGIMGGDLSSVTESTKNVLLFVQTYEPKHIRKTSLITQERTLAAKIFEKQPDSNMVIPVLIEGVKLIQARAKGVINSTVIDIFPNPPQKATIELNLEWLHQFTGIKIPKNQIISMLNNLGFNTELTGETLRCEVPSWRKFDVTIKEDIVEEITRIYGYFKLPSVLPITDIPKLGADSNLALEQAARIFLAKLGFTETYNYSLVSKELLQQSNAKTTGLFKLQNPLSEEYVYMRLSLIPSLLQNLDFNRGTTALPMHIFELANVYHKQNAHPLANEVSTLAFASIGSDFRSFRGQVDALCKYLHVEWKLDSLIEENTPFDKNRSGIIKGKNGTILGHMGYIKSEITKSFHLSDDVLMCEIDFSELSTDASLIHQFTKIPAYPPVIEDLTFTIKPKTPVDTIINTVKEIDPIIESIELKTIYNQNYTFTLTYRSKDSNLKTETIAPIRQKIVSILSTKLDAALVGQLPQN